MIAADPAQPTRRAWTKPEEDVLRAGYTREGIAHVAKELGRSYLSVREKAGELGFRGAAVEASKENGVFNPTDLAAMIGVERRAIHGWCYKGCPYRVVGGRGERVLRWSEVRAWLATQPRIFYLFPFNVREKMGVDFDEIYVTAAEAASRIGCTYKSLDNWRIAGCPSLSADRRSNYFMVRDVMKWLLANPNRGQHLSSAYVRKWEARLDAEPPLRRKVKKTRPKKMPLTPSR